MSGNAAWLKEAKAMLDSTPLPAPRQTESPRMQQRVYQGGVLDRLTSDWVSIDGHADRDIWYAILATRARARDLVQNNDYARQFMRLLQQNVVGPYGFSFEAKISKLLADANGDPVMDDQANSQVEKLLERWSRKSNCTVTGEMTFLDVCNLVVQQLGRDGEYIVRKVPTRTTYGMQLQVIEPDDLNERLNMVLPNGNFIRMGIEYNKVRRPQAYWFKNVDPAMDLYFTQYASGNLSDNIRIPAEQIIHGFLRERPSQSRGITWFAPSMLRLKMLGGYEEAGLENARVSAAKMLFFKRVLPDAEKYVGQGKTDQGAIINRVEPGAAELLPYGVEPAQWTPDFPTTQYADYVRAILRGISTGLGPAYTSLANDLREVNFSSIRMGLQQERDWWRSVQQFFTDHFLVDVSVSLIEAAWLRGTIDLTIQQMDQIEDSVWSGRDWESPDPLKDAEANVLNVQAGFKSSRQIISARNDKWKQTYKEISEEKKYADSLGINRKLDEIKIAPKLLPKDSGDGSGGDGEGDEGNINDPGRSELDEHLEAAKKILEPTSGRNHNGRKG